VDLTRSEGEKNISLEVKNFTFVTENLSKFSIFLFCFGVDVTSEP